MLIVRLHARSGPRSLRSLRSSLAVGSRSFVHSECYFRAIAWLGFDDCSAVMAFQPSDDRAADALPVILNRVELKADPAIADEYPDAIVGDLGIERDSSDLRMLGSVHHRLSRSSHHRVEPSVQRL